MKKAYHNEFIFSLSALGNRMRLIPPLMVKAIVC